MNIPEAHYRISVKWICTNSEWKVLMMLNRKRRDLPWWWIDHGEDFTQALIREVKEEMWLEVIQVDKMPHYFMTKHTKWRRNIANVMIRMKLENYEFTATDECEDIGFFSLEEIVNLWKLPYTQIVQWAKYMIEENKDIV